MKQNFPWSEVQFHELEREAVAGYWKIRAGQQSAQRKRKVKDAGTRGAVTGGKHLDPLSNLLKRVVVAAGFDATDVYCDSGLILPGYYRAQKKWDLVVAREGRLHAAIELKSQSGSFGNNQNNRTEEVLGVAHDFWTAYRERTFGLHRPWIGYVFMLEDSPKSRRAVATKDSPFPALPIFENASYMDRYRILCERLVFERDYDATALILTKKDGIGNYEEPAPAHSLYAFCEAFYRRLKAEA